MIMKVQKKMIIKFQTCGKKLKKANNAVKRYSKNFMLQMMTCSCYDTQKKTAKAPKRLGKRIK